MKQSDTIEPLSNRAVQVKETIERLDADVRKVGLELVDDDGLTLTDGQMSVRGDYTRMTSRLKPANLNRELLVRAAKIKRAAACADDEKPLTAIDATAGLGEDALLLAAAGFEVQLFERNPVIAALLRDTIARAGANPELCEAAHRMHVTEQDSIAALRELTYAPDVVVLDPMFPEKQKRSAVKKKLQLLQRLEQPCEDEFSLLEAAIAAKPRKVIIKRPVKGPHLAGRTPSYSLAGKAIRYDCIALPRPADSAGH